MNDRVTEADAREPRVQPLSKQEMETAEGGIIITGTIVFSSAHGSYISMPGNPGPQRSV